MDHQDMIRQANEPASEGERPGSPSSGLNTHHCLRSDLGQRAASTNNLTQKMTVSSWWLGKGMASPAATTAATWPRAGERKGRTVQQGLTGLQQLCKQSLESITAGL